MLSIKWTIKFCTEEAMGSLFLLLGTFEKFNDELCEFSFRGFYLGRKVHSINGVLKNSSTLEKGEVYWIKAKFEKLEEHTLYCEILQIKGVDDLSLEFNF